MRFSIVQTEHSYKDLRRLKRLTGALERFVEVREALATDRVWASTKPLKGFDGFRTRTGDLRVIWRTRGSSRTILRVGLRKEVYKNLRTADKKDFRSVGEDADETLASQADKSPTFHSSWDSLAELHSWIWNGNYRYRPALALEQEYFYACLKSALRIAGR